MKQNTVTQSATLMDAARAIESTKRLAVVIDQESRVIGTLTDGDIRRALLNGSDLNTRVTEAMNKHPLVSRVDTSDSLLQKMLIYTGFNNLFSEGERS